MATLVTLDDEEPTVIPLARIAVGLQVQGQNTQVTAMIDTRASHNLLSFETFINHFHEVPLTPTSSRMIAVNGQSMSSSLNRHTYPNG